tara:strand:+ start:43920 stop:44228 length:309 start_codon:yes stop_codon:yes gene_type:complete
MSLPIHLQAEVNQVCEVGLEGYIAKEHRKERRGFIEDGIITGTAISGLSYLGFKQNYLPNYFIPIPLLISFISSLIISSKHVGKNDDEYEKAYNQICGMNDN